MLARNVGGLPPRRSQLRAAVVRVSLLSRRPETLSSFSNDPIDNRRTFFPPPPPPPSSPPFSDCLACFFFTHLSLLVPHRPPASFISLFPRAFTPQPPLPLPVWHHQTWHARERRSATPTPPTTLRSMCGATMHNGEPCEWHQLVRQGSSETSRTASSTNMQLFGPTNNVLFRNISYK